MNYSLPEGLLCPLLGILQARILAWAVMPSFRGSSQPRDRTHVSDVSSKVRRVLYHLCHLGCPFAISVYLQQHRKCSKNWQNDEKPGERWESLSQAMVNTEFQSFSECGAAGILGEKWLRK